MNPIELQNVKMASVFGLGKSGVAALRLLKQAGIKTKAINEGQPAEWYKSQALEGLIDPKDCIGQDSPEASLSFAQSDLIVLSPGIPMTHAVLSAALKKGVKLVSEIELAYWFCQKTPIIAITGTNGKTTTTTMISEALQLASKKVFCGGNIGIPYCDMALEVLKGATYDYAVIEVSSFQLETIEKFHPHIALILNLTLNHSERYQGLQDYGEAKLRLIKNMTARDHLIIGTETGPMVEWVKSSPAEKYEFSKNNLPGDFLRQFDFSKGLLVGTHNKANYYCAWKALDLLGLQNLSSLFQNFIQTFKGVPHRLEFVGEFNGLKVYNDAKSTNAEATRTALSAFEDGKELYLIVGGKLRNESDKLLPEIQPFSKQITKIFTLGMTTERLYNELKGSFQVEKGFDLDQILAQVKAQKLKGNLVFSPAHPSFDQFKNYVNRGEVFKEKVRTTL